MLIYTKPHHIPASRSTNWYDYDKRDALCNKCGETIGTQSKYQEDFFFNEREKANYKFCPYCGEPFYKEEK